MVTSVDPADRGTGGRDGGRWSAVSEDAHAALPVPVLRAAASSRAERTHNCCNWSGQRCWCWVREGQGSRRAHRQRGRCWKPKAGAIMPPPNMAKHWRLKGARCWLRLHCLSLRHTHPTPNLDDSALPLLRAVVSRDHADMDRILSTRGPLAAQHTGLNALHVAAALGWAETVPVLADAGERRGECAAGRRAGWQRLAGPAEPLAHTTCVRAQAVTRTRHSSRPLARAVSCCKFSGKQRGSLWTLCRLTRHRCSSRCARCAAY